MRTLIINLGAAGDVIRTTAILNILEGEIHWLTSDKNAILIQNLHGLAKCISWSEKNVLKNISYDLVINLEDSSDTAGLLQNIKYKELFGAYLDSSNRLTYTESSKEWFDMSLISNFANEKTDELRFKNRKSYQEIILNGLGYAFKGEKYFLPKPIKTNLTGDIAIAPKAGSTWQMKNWAYYNEQKITLEENGYRVNYLPIRQSLIEHIADIQNHHYLISGDSLPMHIALGSEIKCLTIFICTSPWEIYDYGIQKIITAVMHHCIVMTGFVLFNSFNVH